MPQPVAQKPQIGRVATIMPRLSGNDHGQGMPSNEARRFWPLGV
jgi:hypothetical protein